MHKGYRRLVLEYNNSRGSNGDGLSSVVGLPEKCRQRSCRRVYGAFCSHVRFIVLFV